jgi:hypothetical protein
LGWTNPRLKLARNRRIGHHGAIAVRAGKVIWIVLALIVWISTAVSGIIHVIGVVRWTVSSLGVALVVVLSRVATIVAHIFSGSVGWHGWRTNGPRSGDTSRAYSDESDGTSVIRWVVTVTVPGVKLAGKASMGMLLIRGSVFNISGVKGESGGVSQETLPVAPAHDRSYDNEHEYQGRQSSESKNKPRKGFILQEGFSLRLGASA